MYIGTPQTSAGEARTNKQLLALSSMLLIFDSALDTQNDVYSYIYICIHMCVSI